MQLPKAVEIKGLRVLTTEQLATSYGTKPKILQYNFSYNKKRYTEGKHYIALQGEELRTFKADLEIQGNLKYAHTLYLWTEKGALLHAKSLNTDKAWEVYDYLVDFYFRVKEEQPKQPKRKGMVMKVVDNPENPETQKCYQNILESLTTVKVLIDLDNRYTSEKTHNDLRHAIMLTTTRIMDGVSKLNDIKPNMIEKIY